MNWLYHNFQVFMLNLCRLLAKLRQYLSVHLLVHSYGDRFMGPSLYIHLSHKSGSPIHTLVPIYMWTYAYILIFKFKTGPLIHKN